MRIGRLKSEGGIVLVAVMVFTLILTILGFSVLSVADSEIVLTRKDINKTRAFYLAEAGVEILNTRLRNGIFGNIEDTPLGGGSYRIDYYSGANPPYAIVTGKVGPQEKKIKVEASFLAPPYEYGIYAGGADGEDWTLQLRGEGEPVIVVKGDSGGKDIISGNLFVNGDVALYDESRVNPALSPNPYGLNGDVEATGDVDRESTATISGLITENAPLRDPPDLLGMNYAVNNTHNVSQIFASSSVDSRGRLPVGNPLRDVFAKNPTYDRAAECASTDGDDYFFEPSDGFVPGGGSSDPNRWMKAPTPLHAGTDRIYYIDGNLWVNSKSDTYGFNMDGKATIVVTGNIYICDNLKYADADSVLGLVALGEYDTNGDLIGGNVIFGDPVYGTMYTCSAMMFAANNFLFNSKSLGNFPKEPESGFILNGNLSALNKVSLERDWYTKTTSSYPYTQARPARYDHPSEIWVDAVTGAALSQGERETVRHYRMILNYDDRVRTWLTQPPGLPRGVGTIFDGLRNWEELP